MFWKLWASVLQTEGFCKDNTVQLLLRIIFKAVIMALCVGDT